MTIEQDKIKRLHNVRAKCEREIINDYNTQQYPVFFDCEENQLLFQIKWYT